jgi:hypothetical protein
LSRGAFLFLRPDGRSPVLVATNHHPPKQEIPPEHASRLKKPLACKEDEVIVFWIEDWSFSVRGSRSIWVLSDPL